MVKSRKNNLHLEVSNDVDLEYETASTTSRRTKKGKGNALTKTKKVSLKAKAKKSGSSLVINGKKIPLAKKMSSQSKVTKKASSAGMKRAISAKRMTKKVSKTKAAKKASSVGKKPKRAVASKSAKSMTAQGAYSFLGLPQSKGPMPSVPAYQSVFNMNKGCYETLPISVDSGGSEQPPAVNPFPFISSFPPPNLGPWGVEPLYCDLVDMVETSLVQSVCHTSRLEYNLQNRMAAEILAASSLNPNAKEFTPKIPENSEAMTCQNSEKEHHENVSTNSDPEASSYDEIVGNHDEIGELVTEKGIDAKLNSCCDNNSENDSDFEVEEDEEDWDWDSDEEHTSVECVDMSEFEDLFQVNLLVTSLNICHTQVTPCLHVQEVNQKYLCLYPDVSDTRDRQHMVTFSDSLEIILEPENLAEELQEARISDLSQRRADRERNERTLGPILTRTHREKMFRKIYGENL